MDVRKNNMTLERLEQQKSKKIRYSSHVNFLENCLKRNVVPKGFSLRWNMGTDIDSETMEKCDKIKMDASLKLMTLTKETYQKKLCAIKETLNEVGSGSKINIEVGFNSNEYEQFRRKKSRKLQSLLKSDNKTFRDNDGMGFEIRDIKKDGNCYYRCLAEHVFKSEEKHTSIRQSIVDHMACHRDYYEQYVDGHFGQHLLDQEQTNGNISSWGTEAEIFAACNVFNVDISVYKSDGTSLAVLKFEPKNGTASATVFLLLCRNHFNLLKPRNKQSIENPDKESNNNTDLKTKYGLQIEQHPMQAGEFDWFDMKYMDMEPVEKVIQSDPNSHKLQAKRAESGKGKTENIVTNLSSKALSQEQKTLLERGFSFIPTRKKIDVTKLLSDLAEWERRMRLTEYFYHKNEENRLDKDEDQEVKEKEWMKKKSSFTPKPGRDKWLDMYIDVVKNDIVQSLKTNINMNITPSESRALKELLDDDEIVIRPADKGSGIVVINSTDYMGNLEKEMTESSSYRRTDADLRGQVLKNVKKVANRMHKRGDICKELKNYLIPKWSNAGKLKGNPKLHKKGNPYRAIVSGIGTPTEKMAGIVEKELNEFVIKSQSYIKDTTDFLNQLNNISGPLPKNTILFCFDVVKLYPSIPLKEGLEACEEALQSRQNLEIGTEAAMEMIETVLNNNIFNLNDNQFIQTDGIAIGSRLGKNFACAYMRKWDEKLLDFDSKPIFYKRFIDDGFGIWTEGIDKLEEFKDHANKIHENIKVELRWSKEEVEFLDTLVKVKDGTLKTDLYVKPTDKHLYVNVQSSHPNNTKKAIPYGLGIRLKRICSENKDYLRHRKELKQQLRRRGYSSRYIEKQLVKVDKLERKDVLKYKSRKEDKKKRVPLVLTFSKQLPDVHKIVKKHMNILHNSEEMKTVFKDPPIVAYKRDQNLGDVLVHGKLNKVAKTTGDRKSDECKCEVCKKFSSKSEITTAKAERVKIHRHYGCETRNVVYGLFCNECDRVVYVGETERSAKERLKEHLDDIRLGRRKSVPEHFNQKGHDINNVEFILIERCVPKSRYYRQIKELRWIEELQTEYPNGANIKKKLGVLWNEYQ